MNFNAAVEERRTFLKKLGVLAAGMAFAPDLLSAEKTPGKVPRRKLGRNDITVSSLALGGHALRMANDEEAQRIVGNLARAYRSDPSLLPEHWRADRDHVAHARQVGDFIAGMTDPFAISRHRELIGPVEMPDRF